VLTFRNRCGDCRQVTVSALTDGCHAARVSGDGLRPDPAFLGVRGTRYLNRPDVRQTFQFCALAGIAGRSPDRVRHHVRRFRRGTRPSVSARLRWWSEDWPSYVPGQWIVHRVSFV